MNSLEQFPRTHKSGREPLRGFVTPSEVQVAGVPTRLSNLVRGFCLSVLSRTEQTG